MAKAKTTKNVAEKPKVPRKKGDRNVLQLAPILARMKLQLNADNRVSANALGLFADWLQADLQSILTHAREVAANDGRRPTVLKRDVATVFGIMGM